MVDNTDAGSSDPAQDQTEAAGADLGANQETETIEVTLVPTDDRERLQAVQAGGTLKGVRIRISPTAPGLTGVTADGGAKWDGYVSRGVAFRAAVAGDDITAALVAHRDDQAAKEAAVEASKALQAANRAAVEAAGLTWTYDAAQAETAEEAVEVARRYTAEQAERVAAEQQLREERKAEVVAAGLPEGYRPSCDAGGYQPYGVTDPTDNHRLLHYRRYETPDGAVAAAQRHADQEGTKARRKAEKVDWITEHGSDGLLDRNTRGYDCQRRYMDERLSSELPGWTLEKWDGRPDWELKGRSCPTDAALVLEDEAKAAGYNEAAIHWAEWPADYIDEEEIDAASGEVVVVGDFHGYLIYHETS